MLHHQEKNASLAQRSKRRCSEEAKGGRKGAAAKKQGEEQREGQTLEDHTCKRTILAEGSRMEIVDTRARVDEPQIMSHLAVHYNIHNIQNPPITRYICFFAVTQISQYLTQCTLLQEES